MRRSNGTRVLAALALAATTGQSGTCVAQCSVRLPIVAQRARTAATVALPRWSHAIDPRDDPPARRGAADTNLAAANGAVVIADDGGLIALDATTGRERWRTAPAHLGIPAVAGDAVVAADARRQTGALEGARRAIAAFALRDGTPRWRVALPSLQPQPPANSPSIPDPRYLPPVAVASAGDAVLVSTTIDGPRPYEQDVLLTEVDARGRLRWRRVLGEGNVGRVAALHGGIAYLATVEDGALLHDVVRLVALGPAGAFLGALEYKIGPLAWNAHGDPFFADAFSNGSSTFAVESVALADFRGDDQAGVAGTRWTYAPDALPSIPGFGEVGIDDGYVYGLIHAADENGAARLYRYRLAPPDGQRPLLLGTEITHWIAGPANGWNVVEDGDGLVALRVLGGGREERLRLARYAPSVTVDAAAFDGHRLYVARYDGHVQGFDLDRATTILDGPTSCAPDDAVDRQHAWRGIGVHDDRIIAVCARRVYAFARP